jgi:hypothetical protein
MKNLALNQVQQKARDLDRIPKSSDCSRSVFRIQDILGWIRIRIRGSVPLDPDPDPAIFVIDLQDASKKLIFNTLFSA